MTLEDVKKLDLLQTRGIAADTKDQQTHAYIVSCLQAFYSGNYGTVPAEDTDANNAELEDDIYIIACFSQEIPGIDANHVMIMYVTEY